MFRYNDVLEDLLVERLLNDELEEIPVIITAKNCECDDLEKYVIEVGGKVKHKLPIIQAVAAYMPSVGVRSMTREKVINKILLDDRAYKLMDTASITIGADYANEYGLTGKNIGIAVIDTGISPHADLTIPMNRIIAFKDFIGGKNQPYDDDGHGTHVAGIIAGNGFSSRGKYMGIAPDANIIGIKALDKDGSGNVSDVIAGIQWAVDNKDRYKIKIITLSLGTKAKAPCHEDPLCKAVDAAINKGITVITAAGNSGPEASTITSPGINPNAITVGAYNDRSIDGNSKKGIPNFSSRGPTPEGFPKPDILAPGVDIYSLKNGSGGYIKLTGTSMAAPIVAGCTALMLENNEHLTPKEIKSIIIQNATNLGFDPLTQGSGLLDIRKILYNMNPSPNLQTPKETPIYQNHKPKKDSFVFRSWFFVILIVILILIL